MIARRYRVTALVVWPGLPQIWSGQVAFGLTLAAFFTVLVNLAVVSQWVYVRWFDDSTRQALWVVTGLLFTGMASWTVVWAWKFHPDRFAVEIDSLYREAADSYLKGKWAQSRDQLERLILLDPSDTEAHLRLAKLLHRTGETVLARRVLDQCRDTPGAKTWWFEIDRLAESLARKPGPELPES
ncbi:hypothetical protein GC170_08295 [bacterium]|nr:hypothetical protein [bacterium]